MRKAVLLGVVVLLMCVLMAPPAAAERAPQTLSVGTSSLCTYHTIADAIAAAQPGDTIKVQAAIFYEPELLINEDLTLIGGYASADPYACLTQTGVGRATYRRSGATERPALAIDGATVTVQWFIIEMNAYGSGVFVFNGGSATLEHVIVRDNDAIHGGGVYAAGSHVTLRDSEVRDNTADSGGGLFVGDGATVVAERSLIRGNKGWQSGAGVFMYGGASFSAVDETSIESNVTQMGCDYGGGIFANGSGTEVLIDASQVVSNTALLEGGGIYLETGASATLQNLSLVRKNRAFGPASGAGGGVFLTGDGTMLTVRRSSIVENWADPWGGGIANDGGIVHLDNSLLMSNSTRSAGGGIYNSDGALIVKNSYVISNEVTDGDGGGIYSVAGVNAFDVDATWFVQNRAPAGDGGGVYASHPALAIERSYLAGNSSVSDGSAVFLPGTCCAVEEAQLVNNLLVDNPQSAPLRAGPPAGGSTVYAQSVHALLLHNTLAHQAPLASFGVYVGPDATIEMTNNIVANFYVGIRRPSTTTGTATADYTLFAGNTYDYDPGVTSSHEVHGDPAFAGSGDYHITAGSAAIDTGVAAGITIDFDGAARPWGGGYDIGADEYPPRVSVYLPIVRRGQ